MESSGESRLKELLMATAVAVVVALATSWGSRLLGAPAPAALSVATGVVAAAAYLVARRRQT